MMVIVILINTNSLARYYHTLILSCHCHVVTFAIPLCPVPIECCLLQRSDLTVRCGQSLLTRNPHQPYAGAPADITSLWVRGDKGRMQCKHGKQSATQKPFARNQPVKSPNVRHLWFTCVYHIVLPKVPSGKILHIGGMKEPAAVRLSFGVRFCALVLLLLLLYLFSASGCG